MGQSIFKRAQTQKFAWNNRESLVECLGPSTQTPRLAVMAAVAEVGRWVRRLIEGSEMLGKTTQASISEQNELSWIFRIQYMLGGVFIKLFHLRYSYTKSKIPPLNWIQPLSCLGAIKSLHLRLTGLHIPNDSQEGTCWWQSFEFWRQVVSPCSVLTSPDGEVAWRLRSLVDGEVNLMTSFFTFFLRFSERRCL